MDFAESDRDKRPQPLPAGDPDVQAVLAGAEVDPGGRALPHPALLTPPQVRNPNPLMPPWQALAAAAPVRPNHPARSSKMVILASAAVGLLILGSYLAQRRASAAAVVPPATPVEHLDMTEVNALPDPLPAVAQAALAGKLQAPAWMQSLDRNSGGDLEYPLREAVEELQPTLRWPSFSGIYQVAILGPDHQLVARAELYGETHWTVPVELQRGSAYMWEVAAIGQARRSTFRVVEDGEEKMLEGLRANHPESHLILGVACLQLGLRTAALTEFNALVQQKPDNPEAMQLLHAASDLR